jgi:hypothetical protein
MKGKDSPWQVKTTNKEICYTMYYKYLHARSCHLALSSNKATMASTCSTSKLHTFNTLACCAAFPASLGAPKESVDRLDPTDAVSMRSRYREAFS